MNLTADNKSSSLISTDDLSREDIERILKTAELIEERDFSTALQGKILANCFFEPSTRTNLSFAAAMYSLGGQVIGFANEHSTSQAKGESLADTMRMIAAYSDLIVIRHPYEGAARLTDEVTSIPVINAGDGANQHPTQMLTDLYTIKECQGRLENLHIALVGDLKYGRTVHSLATACALFPIQLYLICPQNLSLPDQILHRLRQRGVKYSFHRSIEEVIDKVDILYMTRLQKERFEKDEHYHKNKQNFILHPELLKNCKPNLKVLHPLPRIDEIATEVDDLPQAHYFQQASNGVALRKALLLLALNRGVL